MSTVIKEEANTEAARPAALGAVPSVPMALPEAELSIHHDIKLTPSNLATGRALMVRGDKAVDIFRLNVGNTSANAGSRYNVVVQPVGGGVPPRLVEFRRFGSGRNSVYDVPQATQCRDVLNAMITAPGTGLVQFFSGRTLRIRSDTRYMNYVTVELLPPGNGV